MKLETITELRKIAEASGYEIINQRAKLGGRTCYRLAGYSYELLLIEDLRNILVHHMTYEAENEE